MLRSFPSKLLRSGLVVKSMLFAIASLATVVLVVNFAVGDNATVESDEGYVIVTESPMELVLSQAGEIDSADNQVLISHCEWSTRVLSIKPEGTWVNEGDIIAELDSSEIEERFRERAILFVNAQAKLADAREDLHIQELTNASRIAAAKLKAKLARLELDGYRDAEHPQKLHQLQAAVELAREELARSEKQLEYVTEMTRLGYRSNSEREQERINLMKKKQAFETSLNKMTMFESFTHERSLTQLQAAAIEAEKDVERVRLSAKSALLSRQIKLSSRQRSHDIYEAYQERLKKNIAACVIPATRSGELVYARESSYSNDRVEEGSYIRYLQPIAKIPDRDRLLVKLRVHEASIGLVRTGQPATLSVDAMGRAQYRGHVKHVAKVSSSGRDRTRNVREYKVTVVVDEDSETSRNLAPGMTATVELLADTRESAMQIPLSSVIEVGGRHVAFVRQDGVHEHRFVEIGMTSDSTVEILSGLSLGEAVVQKPRIQCADQIAFLHNELPQPAPSQSWLTQLD